MLASAIRRGWRAAITVACLAFATAAAQADTVVLRNGDRLSGTISHLSKHQLTLHTSWGGEISEHISDTNFGILLHDLYQQRNVIVYSTDLDGDRLTDLMADAADVFRGWGQKVLDHVRAGADMNKVWKDMGFTMTNGKDMTSVMYRVQGEPIFEQTLGSADAMLLRLLAGDETVGGTKQPYDPRIHFVLINEAYKAANPGNERLAGWLDAQLDTFDKIYSGKRPRYLEGYRTLKAATTPWGTQ